MKPPIDNAHHYQAGSLEMPPRLLLGPGPSNSHPRVLAAMAHQPVGHLDPAFLEVMDEVQELLRYAWQTDNVLTLPVSGTGTAAMEASIANIVEPDDVVLVGVNGYFGQRLVDMAGRYGGDVRVLEKEWGGVFTLDEIGVALEKHRPAVLALVHAETSTGARQPLEGVADLCRPLGCLLLVDTVTSLGGVPLYLDEWGVDIAYSGSQKCLSCPPGASPLTLGPRAVAKLDNRKAPVANFYLDLTLLRNYWGAARAYHHTAPINNVYALRESLRLVSEEGLQARWERHRQTAGLFRDGLDAIGLECHVEDADLRLPSLTTVRVPEGVDARAVARQLLETYNIEIAGGFGQLAGKVWRIGLMGYNSRRENVVLLLEALRRVLG